MLMIKDYSTTILSSANVIFLLVMLVGPILTFSSSSWMLCWVGVELTFLGFIPLIYSGSSMNKEAAIKYFCVQALSSGILFMSGILYLQGNSILWTYLFIISLGLKLGLFPGHFWVPSVVSSLDYFPMFLLLTWQKLPPLGLMCLCIDSAEPVWNLALLMGGLSSVVGGILGNNFNSTRAMLGASSIAHSGWLVVGATSGSMWFYFILYSLVTMAGVMMMWDNNSTSIAFFILSLSGLPPFLMFLGKYSVLLDAYYMGLDTMYLLLPVLGTVLSLSFYLKFTYSYYVNSTEIYLPMSLFTLNVLGLLYLFL